MDRADRGFDTSRPLGSFVEVARGALLEPAAFFAGLGGPRPGRVKGPLVFAIICGVISLPLSLIAEPFDPLRRGQPGMGASFSSLYESNPGAAIALAALIVVLLPLFAVLGVYIGAAIQHLFVRGGAGSGAPSRCWPTGARRSRCSPESRSSDTW